MTVHNISVDAMLVASGYTSELSKYHRESLDGYLQRLLDNFDPGAWKILIKINGNYEICGTVIPVVAAKQPVLSLGVDDVLLYDSFIPEKTNFCSAAENGAEQTRYSFKLYLDQRFRKNAPQLLYIIDAVTGKVIHVCPIDTQMCLDQPKLKNIARSCKACQSSSSPWSVPGESNNALFGIAPNGYAFHTDKGENEWWMADLLQSYTVYQIKIYLRPCFTDRNRLINVAISQDMLTWFDLGEAAPMNAGGVLIKNLGNRVTRFIRLSVKNEYFHLRKVEIYSDLNTIAFRRDVLIHVNDTVAPNIQESIRKNKYESSEIYQVLKHLQPDDIVLELGASLGAMSTVVLKRVSLKSYTAVEANPALIPIIQENHRLNDVSCKILNGAVAKEDGSIDFYVHRACWASSIRPFPHPLRVEKVKAFALDRLLNESEANFLICDIEGGEHQVFTDKLDLNRINKICIELHGKNTGELCKLYNYFIDKGYKSDKSMPTSGLQAVYYFYR